MDAEIKPVSDFVLQGTLTKIDDPGFIYYHFSDWVKAVEKVKLGEVPSILSDSTYIINRKTYLKLLTISGEVFMKVDDWTPIRTIREFLSCFVLQSTDVVFERALKYQFEFFKYASNNS